ncbi:hypothetical protein acdb102_23540 [Acidothermaceae bacterium B102]|nr:hypothetical protein acdb102_23540 [Acidothermaceae bacterium B102]
MTFGYCLLNAVMYCVATPASGVQPHQLTLPDTLVSTGAAATEGAGPLAADEDPPAGDVAADPVALAAAAVDDEAAAGAEEAAAALVLAAPLEEPDEQPARARTATPAKEVAAYTRRREALAIARMPGLL